MILNVLSRMSVELKEERLGGHDSSTTSPGVTVDGYPSRNDEHPIPPRWSSGVPKPGPQRRSNFLKFWDKDDYTDTNTTAATTPSTDS